MPYIGNTAADRFVASKAATQFSGDGSTTAFTLEHSVGADEDILVSVDGVVQEPSVAYAVSNGTTLTFTAAPSSNSGNNIFVYYLFRTVATVSHPSNQALSATSGTFSGAITGGGLLTTGGNVVIPDAGNIGSASDTDAIAISSGGVVTFTNNIVEPAKPMFFAQGTGQSISQNTETTIAFPSEKFNTGFNYNTSTYRVTPGLGKYRLFAALMINNISSPTDRVELTIIKYDNSASSTTDIAMGEMGQGTQTNNTSVFVEVFIEQTDANDYYYCTAMTTAGTRTLQGDSTTAKTYFGGHLIG
jgi:hypothetical protein